MKFLTLPAIALLSCSAIAAPQTADANAAIQELRQAVSFADAAIRDVQGQEAVNQLHAAIAEADLTIALASASEAIRDVQGQEAVNMLAASVANADLNIAFVEAQVAINQVGDDQLLNELSETLANADDTRANDMIMAVVSERPMLAAAVQDRALGAGINEALVANALTAGFGEAAATAAGK